MRILPLLCLFMASAQPMVAVAQSGDVVTLRVGKLEKEMKAVQRKVFPQGAPVEPEIGGTTLASPDGSPASSPVSDLTARVDAIESQQKSLTGEVERQGFRLKRAEDALKAMEARLKALEPSEALAVAPENVVPAPTLAPKPVAVAPKPVAKPVVAVAPKPMTEASVKAPVTNDPKRKALVDAVPIPVTNDPVDDSYSYGFRLWSAKLYPEAQRHLKSFIAKYPTHKRESHARNLLGRAYFDDRLYNAASKSFLENYQDNAKGERAAESLSWLGLALQRLSPPQAANACKVYKEFDDVYGDSAAADVRARVAKGRADAKCAA